MSVPKRDTAGDARGPVERRLWDELVRTSCEWCSYELELGPSRLVEELGVPDLERRLRLELKGRDAVDSFRLKWSFPGK